MPVRGNKPKPAGEALNRNPQVHTWVEVENVPNDDGPRLTFKRANGEDWSEPTRRKWQAWRRMPHTRLWTEADWQFAFDALEVCERFLEGGATAYASELRQREAIMGTTLDARLGLKLRYVEPKADKPALAVVSNADDFRNL